MIPIFQEKGSADCFRCCIASIFEIPLTDVPVFSDSNWRNELQIWLKPHGFFYIDVAGPDLEIPQHSKDILLKEVYPYCGYHVITGAGIRGRRHSVVGFSGSVVHDPNPEPTGLRTIEEIGFFIPLFPRMP